MADALDERQLRMAQRLLKRALEHPRALEIFADCADAQDVESDALSELGEYDGRWLTFAGELRALSAKVLADDPDLWERDYPQPEAVQVPKAREMDGAKTDAAIAYTAGWNACREEFLAAAPQPPAQAEPCDMGPICIGCEPRGPRGECPGAQAEVRGGEPFAWIVCWPDDDGVLHPGFAAAWKDAAHEHINDAISEGVDEASKWVVRPVYIRPAPAAPQAGEAEPLFLLHTGQIDGGGEQDEWETEANSWTAVEEFCRQHPGKTIGLYPASQPMSREGLSQAAHDVLAERRRQIEAEGWTPEHDDEHGLGELARAAACYALHAASQASEHPGISLSLESSALGVWPWDQSWHKPGDQRRNLVKAGALILAELERLDRASAHGIGSGSGSGTGASHA